MSGPVPNSRSLTRWLHVAILLLAAALRFFRLGAGSLWYDEAVSVFLAGKDVAGLVAHTAGDIHPPGYYLLLHGWQRLAGDSDFAAAFLSLWFGVLLVALAGRLGRRLLGPWAGVAAAFLVAVSPYNVWYSQEVRMYTLGAALAAGVLDTTLSLLPSLRPGPGRRATPRRSLAPLAGYAVLAALGLWTLYYFAFLLIAINVLALIWWMVAWRRGRAGLGWLGRWALAQAGALLLYAPWLPVAWRQATDPPVPPWRSFTAFRDVLLETWTALSAGQSAALSWTWPALLAFVVLLAAGLVRRRGRGWRLASISPRATGMAASVFGPVLLIYLASFVTPLYHVRYAFTYSTAFYAVAGVGLARTWRYGRRAAIVTLAAVVLVSGASIGVLHTAPRYAADDHQAAVTTLAGAWRPGDAILVNAGYAYPAFLAYWPDAGGDLIAWRGRLVDEGRDDADLCQGPALYLTGTVDGDPGLGWGDPASDFYAMDWNAAEEALSWLFDNAHRVWVYRIYDTVTDPEGWVRAWLDAHGTAFADYVFGGESQLRVQGYLTGADPLGPPCPAAPESGVVGAGALALEGVTPLPAQVAAGGTLDLAAVWRAGDAPAGSSPLADAYLFAGLFDDEGGRWAQADARPAGPLYPAGSWPAGAQVRTPLRVDVPVSTPPGDYRVALGWYRFEAGLPVWLPWPDGHLFTAGQVRVVPPAAGWANVAAPEPAFPAGVDLGGARLLGFDAGTLGAAPGDVLALHLLWRAPGVSRLPLAAAPAVLQLVDGDGAVVAAWASGPAGGRAPFPGLAPGQIVRDPRWLALPGDLAPGVYDLYLGRRTPDGAWLPVRRGPVALGPRYPLATVRVAADGE